MFIFQFSISILTAFSSQRNKLMFLKMDRVNYTKKVVEVHCVKSEYEEMEITGIGIKEEENIGTIQAETGIKIEEEQEDPLKLLSCQTCQRAFADEKSLRRHRAVHAEPRPYKCHICGKSYLQLGSLDSHVERHATKSFECSICDRKFVDVVTLSKHKSIHSDDKQFPCNICDKIFYSKELRIEHLASHSRDNLFICNVCDEKFTRRGALTSHMLKHAGGQIRNCRLKTRPVVHAFPCDLCRKVFRRENLLTKHILTSHEPVTCGQCGEQFSNRSNLSNHMLLGHAKKQGVGGS